MAMDKTCRIRFLQELCTTNIDKPISITELTDRFGVTCGTIYNDITVLVRNETLSSADLIRLGFLRKSSLDELKTVSASWKSTTEFRKRWIRSAVTLLLNYYQHTDVRYGEQEAFLEARLICSVNENRHRRKTGCEQLQFSIVEDAPDPSIHHPEYCLCEELRCLRTFQAETSVAVCPPQHGLPRRFRTQQELVGQLGELVLSKYLKTISKTGELTRIEYLNQRHALRGSDPTMRKRPDFIVQTPAGHHFHIDVKVRRDVGSGCFLLDRASAKIMTYWENPIVVFFERMEELDIDRNNFYVMNSELLHERLTRRKMNNLPIRISRLERNTITFRPWSNDMNTI